MIENHMPAGVSTWDSALLAPIAEINEQLLEALQAMALQDELRTPSVPRLVQMTREAWRRLDASALKRLSTSPFLLLDAGFSQLTHWQGLALDGVKEQSGQEVYFSGAAGTALLRQTLLLAWHVARSNRLMANVMLGMTAAVADCLAAKRLTELEALAARAPAWILPRWERQPVVWRQMLDAARVGHPSTLRTLHMRGWQLLAR
jgi:hypothetical protein